MKGRQKQVIEMYERVQDFLGAYPPPPSTGYDIQKQALDGIVARLTGHSSGQLLGGRMSRSETQRQAALRKKLREQHLAPLAKIARASVADVPGVAPALKAPAPNLSSKRLIDEAKAMRDAAAQFEPLFVEGGRPEDFLARLDDAIATLRESMLIKGRTLGDRVGSRKGLSAEIQRGRKAVDCLDTIVRGAFSDQPDVLERWRVARRIHRLPGGSATATGGTADGNIAPEVTGQGAVTGTDGEQPATQPDVPDISGQDEPPAAAA